MAFAIGVIASVAAPSVVVLCPRGRADCVALTSTSLCVDVGLAELFNLNFRLFANFICPLSYLAISDQVYILMALIRQPSGLWM